VGLAGDASDSEDAVAQYCEYKAKQAIKFLIAGIEGKLISIAGCLKRSAAR
jgi:hypothetical protein